MTLFTEAELRALLQREEGQVLDFKSLWDKATSPPRVVDRRAVRDWIAEYVAAFANADGGTLVLGVDDDGAPSGHGYPEEAIVEFQAVPTTARPSALLWAEACAEERRLSGTLLRHTRDGSPRAGAVGGAWISRSPRRTPWHALSSGGRVSGSPVMRADMGHRNSFRGSG